MLALTRRTDESVTIYAPGVGKIRLIVAHIGGSQVRILFDAPPAVMIVRDEILPDLDPKDRIHIRIPRCSDPLTFCKRDYNDGHLRATSYLELEAYPYPDEVVCPDCRAGLDRFLSIEERADHYTPFEVEGGDDDV